VFVEARKMPDHEKLTGDVCIVGAGAAGLAIAIRLAETGLRTILVESGGFIANGSDTSLNDGVSNLVNYPFKETRARIFGGTTTLWTGACIPLDKGDFEPRPWLSHSGWPVSRQEIESYYSAAAEVFGLPTDNAFQGELDGTAFNSGILQSKVVSYSNPLDLGRKFKSRIGKSEQVICLLNATVTNIQQNDGANQVEKLEVQTLVGNKISIKARHFVLATGGIENARLLLASDIRPKGDRGEMHDTVGRYHMEHPIKSVGVLALRHRDKNVRLFTDRHRAGRTKVQGTFGLSQMCRERHQLLDMHIRVYRYHPLEDRKAIIAAKTNFQDSKTRSNAGVLGRYVRDHGARLGTEIIPYLTWHFWNKVNPKAGVDNLRFTAFVEQEPDAENRIELSHKRNALGVPLPRLVLRESAFMHDSAARSLQLMSEAFLAMGYGELRYQPHQIAHLAHYDKFGLHQMGSTRMSATAHHGVVDRNCKVHGYATLTIVALSLRLADHLVRINAI
jgi:choline dehydrogenase-like flavoprotein